MKSKIKKEIEYDEAPSGFVTFYNYKEPLMKFKEGTGFIGVLAFDGETEQIQCHFCGEWFGSLSHHIAREHNMTAADYKESVGLNQTTALISESMRAKLIASGMEKRLKNLRPGGKHSKQTKKKIGDTLRKNSMENKNLRGTCPEQLISRLYNKYIELGRKPLEREFSLWETIRRTYGDAETACRIAGIPYTKPGKTLYQAGGAHLKYTREVCVKYIQTFYETHNRAPKRKDGRTIWERIRKYGRKKLIEEALGIESEYYNNVIVERVYSRDELLKFLANFKKINGRQASYSDARRGLIPSSKAYSKEFKSLPAALKLI